MSKTKKYEPKPLYRKVNTTAHAVKGRLHRRNDNNPRYERGSFKDEKLKNKMKTGQQFHGLDFSPLFAFLRKKVGNPWSEVQSEALKRLPNEMLYNPLEKAVVLFKHYQQDPDVYINRPYFINSEASYHSLLFVDENGILQYVNKEFSIDDVKIQCRCCTHSFNGVPISRKYKESVCH